MTIDSSLNERLRRIVRKHEKMKTNGVVHRVGPDGLIRSRPRLVRPRFPFRGAMIVVTLLILFKSVLFAQLGALSYNLKVEELRNGSLVEKAGAVVMQAEPVTTAIGGFLRPYLSTR